MTTSIKKILKALDGQNRPVNVVGLHGAAKGLVISRLAGARPADAIIIVTSTQERAQELSDECAALFQPDDRKRIKLFPESSVLPFSRLSPEPEDWAERLFVLDELAHGAPLVLVASVSAVMRRTPPASFIKNAGKILHLKEENDPFELQKYLTDYGYEDVGLVEDEGSFARRGGIVDIWTPTRNVPVRIEFDGDKIAAMRAFDPASQRSKEDVFEVSVIPVRDFPFDGPAREAAAKRIRERAEKMDIPAREWRAVTEAIREGIAFSGIETFMPMFHETTGMVFDYLQQNAVVVVDDATETLAAAETHWKELASLAKDTQSPERIIAPDEIVILPADLEKYLARFAGLKFNAYEETEKAIIAKIESNADLKPIIHSHASGEDMLSPVVAQMKKWQADGMRIVLTCHTGLQAERLIDIFKPHGLGLRPVDAPFDAIFEMDAGVVRLFTGRMSGGFRWPDEGIVVVTDEELFGRKTPRRTLTTKPMEPFTSFAELVGGDYLVHEQHGIGRYRGLVHLKIEGSAGDFLLIEYLGGDKLYLPVYRLNLVGRYIGSGDAPPFLDKLGGMRWGKTQAKVGAAIRLMAKELLQIHAAREVYPGFPFPEGGMEYEEFCAAFPYDETPDQARAIDDIMRDMGIERPMDRLVCGDVGYGKTEVAMRAAFRAALAGKQVAVLVPTTVLALQHFGSFMRRFKDTAVTIDMLSRFRSAKVLKSTIENLNRGRIDIVIGTHRLLQKDVRFRDLGLLVIDEEHRFGVRDKEKIKKLKASVDVMTLTATPIPRTLNLSLTGIRDISIINTPPVDRLSIATHVAAFDDMIIRQACLRELARGGQVFFVHNRVETIRTMHEHLTKLIPEARIVVGHGQMKEKYLERVMIDFIERRADILLCTTIIESGLDIPTANTIIIARADKFGLADLYQLRGRVGRANMRASAYLLTPEDGEMSALAKKRLTVIKRFTELGSGFQIAMHDLEFRGSGNILGSAQSGHVAAVGYEMYAKLLDREVRKLSGKKIEEEIDPELSLKVAAFLPENYVADPATRVEIYRRLAGRDTLDEIGEMGAELTDRFGALPPEAMNLLGVMEIKVLAKKLKLKQITFDGATANFCLTDSTPVPPEAIVGLVTKEPMSFRMAPPDKLLVRISEGEESGEKVLGGIKNSLSRLLACVSGGKNNC